MTWSAGPLSEEEAAGTGEAQSLTTELEASFNFETLSALLEDVVANWALRADKGRSLNLIAALLAAYIDGISEGGTLQAALEEGVVGVSG